ncbi:hypothetical protein [Streptomyces sp. Sge12]|uniref:hypothetical protein n=1 Tax=Streptomyces sp. Sge12 TaxID=1972846 RepID=UPI00133146A8|nr:hypothetical protein [Streptomyces sp. Sge12]
MEENGERPGSTAAGRSGSRGSASAALAGALIGALSGLGGSVLGYIGAQSSKDATTHARQADIRRAAYGDLGLHSHAFVAELSKEAVLVVEKKTPEAELKKQYNKEFQEARVKVVQAEITARLVATENTRTVMDRAITHRERLTTMMSEASVEGFSKIDVIKFGTDLLDTRDKYQQAMNAFLKSVDAEVI